MLLKVLVVDDLPSSLLIMQNFLAPYGDLQAETAASGREAIELVKKHNYDLIFMDQMMPEMDGIETTAAIRKLEISNANEQLRKSVKQTPIIALTANAMGGMKEYYLEKGFQDYLTKPISPKALDEIIRKWLSDQGTLLATSSCYQHGLTANNNPSPQSLIPGPFSLEIQAQRLDMLNHYLVSFTCVPEADWRTKFDTAYFERFTALIKSLNTVEIPAALRGQAEFLAEAGGKEDTCKVREVLPAFCEALHKWQEQEQKAGHIEGKTQDEILPRLKKAILAGETEAVEAAIGELGEAALTPAGRELYFRLYALMLENDTEKIMEAIKETEHD
jgi:CheY-like chemotaxis protein